MTRRKLKLRMDRIIIAFLTLVVIICLIILAVYSIIVSFNKNQGNDMQKIAENSSSQGSENKESKKTQGFELILANYENNIGPDYAPVELVETEEGVQMDKRIYDSYKKMIEDANKDDAPFWATSAYRSYADQESVFNKQVDNLMEENKDLTKEQAIQEAKTVVAYPGTSEHQTGLAIDIVSNEYTSLDQEAENTKAVKWLFENAHKYGFILRYPKDKQEITKIIYEPWHYRYVGVEHATKIKELGITLEEYLQKLNK